MKCELLIVVYLNVLSACLELDLEIHPVNDPDCIGGEVVGLTNTSVLLEYRQTDNETTDTPPEWMFLADISVSPDAGFNGTLEIPVNSSLPGGVQLRLLQLEHGGGVCNCWTVERMELTVASSEPVVFNTSNNNLENLCYRSDSPMAANICDHGGGAGEARGLITKVVNINGTVGGCPGDTDETLITMKGTPIDSDCSMGTSRM